MQVTIFSYMDELYVVIQNIQVCDKYCKAVMLVIVADGRGDAQGHGGVCTLHESSTLTVHLH